MDNKENNNNKLSFSALGFSTHFNCICKSAKIKGEYKNQPCFQAVFGYVKESAKYEIFMCTDPAILLDRKSNYCIFDIEKIRIWLDYICSIVNARYSIANDSMEIKYYTINSYEHKKYDCYKLCFEIDNECNQKHKFALTAIRYLYEWPMNMLLLDVFRLKCIEEFANETMLNLHNLVTCTVDKTRDPYSGHGHQFTRGDARFISDDELKNKLNTCSNINSMFEKTSCFEDMRVVASSYMLDFWEDDKTFNEERLPIYLYNYELLCKEREINNNK